MGFGQEKNLGRSSGWGRCQILPHIGTCLAAEKCFPQFSLPILPPFSPTPKLRVRWAAQPPSLPPPQRASPAPRPSSSTWTPPKLTGKRGKTWQKWASSLPACSARSQVTGSRQGGAGWPRGAAGAPHISGRLAPRIAPLPHSGHVPRSSRLGASPG